MAKIGKFALYNNQVIPTQEANLSITSSAVLYGLSIYSVFYTKRLEDGSFLVFRLADHIKRLQESSKMLGLGDVSQLLDEQFLAKISALLEANSPTNDQLFRVTIHASDPLPGIKTSNLTLDLSVFMYDADPILPPNGARLKTSSYRRVSDTAIPARAKVNGAYVNSALAREEALDAGADDALFLNQQGFVSELSAANIFIVKNDTLITPDCSSDILEGITRRSLITLAKDQGLEVIERKIALTEIYTADEAFACGTSSFVSPIIELDNRQIANGAIGTITTKLKDSLQAIFADPNSDWTTSL